MRNGSGLPFRRVVSFLPLLLAGVSTRLLGVLKVGVEEAAGRPFLADAAGVPSAAAARLLERVTGD